MTSRSDGHPARASGAVPWTTGLIAVVALGVLMYAVVRAIAVPLTYDEAAAVHRYVEADVLAVFDVSVATNHLLNTILTRAAASIGGTREVVLRLPNLCGLAVYLLFAGTIVSRMRQPLVAVGTFLLLALNPYVLDYFAISRGYGLSLGLLMGGLFHLVRLIDGPAAPDVARSDLSRSLLWTGAAVAANFSLLVAYAAIWCVGLFTQLARRAPATAPQAAASLQDRATSWGVFALAAGGVVFTGLVLSQDVGLSASLHEPVSVRIIGLFEEELDPIVVERLDVRLRWRPLERSGEVWRMEQPEQVRALRVTLTPAAERNLTLIDTRIGDRSFPHGRHARGAWSMRELDGERVLESTDALSRPRAAVPAMRPAINWAGDRRHALVLAAAFGVATALLGTLALTLWAVGRVLVRRAMVDARSWRVLTAGAMGIVALVGSPAHILRRDGQLYFGGSAGLVPDTFRSLISNSFYGIVYHARQVDVVLAIVACTVVLMGIAAAGAIRHRRGHDIATPAVLFGILAFASAATAAQHALLGTPYLRDRTALFFIPVYVLFLGVLVDRLSLVHRALPAAGGAGVAAAGVLLGWHLALAGNATHVADWPRDADTKRMFADLGEAVGLESGTRGQVSLGVDWIFYPVVRFYAERSRASGIRVDVHVVPTQSDVDYLYLQADDEDRDGRVVSAYPRAGAVLLQRDEAD